MEEDGASFNGFTKETIAFLNGLRDNNNRIWFHRNRDGYEAHVMELARAFVQAMGRRLRTAVPGLIAIPKVNKSIFRLSRDTRFSKDPAPYKTNLGIFFWEGTRSRMECPGFYFHVEPPLLILGGGFYMFPDRLLGRYRRSVVAAALGKELSKIVQDLWKGREWTLRGERYKRVPMGYDPAHPNAAFLLHNGFYTGLETEIPEEFFSARLLDYCFEKYLPLVPLHRWLVKVLR